MDLYISQEISCNTEFVASPITATHSSKGNENKTTNLKMLKIRATIISPNTLLKSTIPVHNYEKFMYPQ